MNIVIAYLIIATIIILTYNQLVANKDQQSNSLAILALSLALIMEDNIIRQIIIISAIIVNLLTKLDSDTSLLMIIATTGLLVLGVAEELIIIYLSIEIVSLSFYVLAARERQGMKSTEAGIKYFILGALSSGIILMGITIVYAQTGTTNLELIDNTSRMLIIVGLLFKLGAAPFHMWVPDVYEGAATIITTYFATVPKIAYLGVLMKLVSEEGDRSILMIGIISILIGSIGAINQTKFKRLLAYSAIGHVGFMLLGIGIATNGSIQAMLIYMIIYLVMTVNTFTIVISQGIKNIAELRGYARRNSVIAITLGLGLMSIAGIPPLGGFYNKYLIILSVVEHQELIYAIIAILISVISSFYYIRIIRIMYFSDQSEITVETPKISVSKAIILGVTSYVILTIMLYPSVLMTITIP